MRRIELAVRQCMATAMAGATCVMLLACTTACSLQRNAAPTQPAADLSAVLAELDAAPVPPGVDPAVSGQLKAELKKVLLARSAAKTAAAVPSTDLSAAAVTYSSGNLVWYYFQQGDYDQNGEVNVADLTPLGANFGTAGPFSWQDAISCVDGDNNGELNIADVTPIGMNFGNRMEGYHIYQSTSQVDYPTSNVAPNGPGAVQMLAVPLNAVSISAGKRNHFSTAYPALNPGDHIWARPYLAAAEGTPSNLYSPGGVWHVVVVAQGEPESCTGAYCSLALIGGRPAIACTADDTPVFVRAADAHGDAWGAPVGIAPLVTTASLTSLASINGVPGIAFNESAQGPIVYTQAPDAAGVTWSEPMEVDQDWPDHALSLAEVNLRAAVAYDKVPHMPGPDELWYERSGNNANTDWASLSTLVCPNVANYASLAVFSGNPAITFTDSTNGLLYVYSTDVNGSV